MFHATENQSFKVLLLFVLVGFSSVPDGSAITFEPLYVDAPGAGFYDRTPLTATERTLLLAGGNTAQTLGEARRNAFESVLGQFELWLIGSSTVRVQASFQNLEQEVLAVGGPGNLIYSRSDPEAPMIHIALAENIFQEELNSPTEPDVVIKFNERRHYNYGLNQEAFRRSFSPAIFVLIAIHEIIHGLGFTDSIAADGSFQLPRRTIYDLNLYSERDDELLINLSSDERRRVITSVNGLLWDGTNNGVDDYSCAQISGRKLVEMNSPDTVRSIVDSEGRVRLHAPAVYKHGGSVSHLAEATLDIMKPSYGSLAYAVFTMGILADMGWELNRDNVKGLVTVEEFLERCTIPAMQKQEPADSDHGTETEGSSGGCAVAETDNALQTTMFNLFLVLSAVFLSVFFRIGRTQ